jgi:hypothetical protein
LYKFHRIAHDSSLLSDSCNVAALPAWLLEFDGESCELSDMRGCCYLNEIIAGADPTVRNYSAETNLRASLAVGFPPMSFGSSQPAEKFGAVTARQLDHALADAQDRSRAALISGDKKTHQACLIEIKIIRQYKVETIGLRGKRREFPTKADATNKAIASAIYRAIEAIRKRCPHAAEYLKKHVKRSAGDEWAFTGTEEWKLEPDVDRSILNELTLEDFQDEVDAEIRPKTEYTRQYFTEHGRTFQYEEQTGIEPEEEAEELRRNWITDAVRTKRLTKENIARAALRKLVPSDPWWFPKQKS